MPLSLEMKISIKTQIPRVLMYITGGNKKKKKT